MSRKLLGIGAVALVTGMLLAGMSFASGGGTIVSAGTDECVTFTSTSTPTRTATNTPIPATATNTPVTPTVVITGQGALNAFGNETPQRTCEATATNTKTPTRTTTAAVTNTVAPTNTGVPATSTPSGGAGAGGLRPPNTGTGPDSASGASTWLLLAGAMLVVSGGGAIAAGARRRS